MAIGTGSKEHFHDVNEPALFDSDPLVLISILECPHCAGWEGLGLGVFGRLFRRRDWLNELMERQRTAPRDRLLLLGRCLLKISHQFD